MNNNEDFPQVFHVGQLPDTQRLVTAETFSKESEDKAARSHETVDEAVPTSTDETIPNYDSKDEKRPNFDSKDETVPNINSVDESDELFRDKINRIGFIQKVLAIKLMQLLAMTAIIALFSLNRISWGINHFINDVNVFGLMILTILAFFVTNIVTFGFLFGRNIREARRKNAFRYMFLIVYPLRLTALIIVCTIYWDAGAVIKSVLLIFIYYCVVVIALLVYSIFSCQTNLDFTAKHGAIVAIGTHMVMCAATIPIMVYMNHYFWRINCIFIICAAVLMILEYVYILYVIQAMTSKNYWRNAPADCLDGAVNLQIDYYFIIRKLIPKIYHKSESPEYVKKIDQTLDV